YGALDRPLIFRLNKRSNGRCLSVFLLSSCALPFGVYGRLSLSFSPRLLNLVGQRLCHLLCLLELALAFIYGLVINPNCSNVHSVTVFGCWINYLSGNVLDIS